MGALGDFAEQSKRALLDARRRFPVVDIGYRTVRGYSDDDAGSYAAALTYYLFFSMFPLFLFAASLLGYLTFGNQTLREDLIRQGVKAVPIIRDALHPDGIQFIIENRRNLLSIGGLLALYSGSGAVVALEHALNRIHGISDEPKFVQKRLRSLMWLGILGIGALLAIGLVGIQQWGADQGGPTGFVAQWGGVAAGIVVDTAVFATAYKFLPAVSRSWREVLPGAAVAGIAFLLLNTLGGWYLRTGSTTRNDTFGTFAAAAVLLLAAYLISQITLISDEVNLALAERRRGGASSLSAEGGG